MLAHRLWRTRACRGEVASATVAGEASAYAYDGIGNFTTVTGGAVTNVYAANELNQYEEVSTCAATLEPTYTSNGELASFGPWTYAYDALSRLVAAYSNGTLVVSNRYDHLGRRVQKIAADGMHMFLYDGWRPVVETVERPGGATDRIEYYWGRDLSGTLDGAAGVGGLLYVKCNDEIYVPFYDAYGNVMGYWDESGAVVAEYVYDAFGRTVAKNGTMADVFSIRYSTKYYDAETGMYYYGRRFYVTALCRWLTRDPIEEQGGVNLYAQSNNNIVNHFDAKGLFVYNTLSANYPLKSDYPTDVTLTNNIWQLIGGKVLQNAKSGTFKNSCAIRLSHSLNKSGELIPYTAGQTSSGKDPPKWWYIFRVAQMKSHLTQKYGTPAVYTDRTKFEKCAPKGILVLDVPGWSDASGHVTLWDGNATIDEAKDEYFGKPNVIFNLWREKE